MNILCKIFGHNFKSFLIKKEFPYGNVKIGGFEGSPSDYQMYVDAHKNFYYEIHCSRCGKGLDTREKRI